MLERKQIVKSLAKKVNTKEKQFFQLINESFDEEARAGTAAKVLMYSRHVEIDKIAECLGGKEDHHKRCFDEYLLRQDYRENDIEKSLRSFMQTFRMAGIDSQVVFKILEHFGAKFYSKDPSGIFSDQTECYEFAYLLIVLQTCQHNKSIK